MAWLDFSTGQTVTLVAVLLWGLIGYILLNVPIAFAIWLVLGIVLAVMTYYGSARFDAWARGEFK